MPHARRSVRGTNKTGEAQTIAFYFNRSTQGNALGNKSKGAPGLAFETWDPRNQSQLESPTLRFGCDSIQDP
jgi:hypothetical protein